MEVALSLFLPVIVLFSALMVLDALISVFETISDWLRGQL